MGRRRIERRGPPLQGVRNALLTLNLLPLAGLAAGFAGRLHPALDSVAAFRLHIALAAASLWALAWLLRARNAKRVGTVSLAMAVLGLTTTLIPAVPPEVTMLRGYSQNLRFSNPSLDQVEAAIRASEADFVLLQEVNQDNFALLSALEDRYPTRIVCDFRGVGGVAILTDLPVFGQEHCIPGEGLAWVEVQVPDGLVTLASLHLGWPWPYRQAGHVQRLLPKLQALPGRVILAGDFNMAPWGASVARVAEATHTAVVPGLRLTFDRDPLWPGLPLDHVLMHRSLAARVQMLGKLGSDHSALLAEIGLR